MKFQISSGHHNAVLYETKAQFEDIMMKALAKHVDMIQTQLLNFRMHFWEHELADIVHGTHWFYESIEIFRNLFRLENTPEHAKAGPHHDHATHLLFALKMALMTEAPHAIAEDSANRARDACDIPQMRAVAFNVLKEYFDAEQGGYSGVFYYEDDSVAPSTLHQSVSIKD